MTRSIYRCAIFGAARHAPMAHPVMHEKGLRFVGPGFSPDARLQPPAAPPEHRANQCAGPILGPIVPECLRVRAEARTHWSVGGMTRSIYRCAIFGAARHAP